MPKEKPAAEQIVDLVPGPGTSVGALGNAAQRGTVKVAPTPGEVKNPESKTLAKDLAPFTRLDGEPLPSQEAWGALPYSELGPMFLDQFLMRYFLDILKPPDSKAMDVAGPWKALVEANPWARLMPQLFWQLTGYELSTRQLNVAAEEYFERISTRPAGRGGGTNGEDLHG